MYLARSIQWKGVSHQMVGVIPADAVMYERPQGRGLVLLEETEDSPWPSADGASKARIPGHEFHYAALENLSGGHRFAYRVARGAGIGGGRDGIVIGTLIASFSHLRSSPRNPWVERFVAFVRSHRERAAEAASKFADAPLELHL